MASTDNRNAAERELLASRRAMWQGFLKFSTYSIVVVAIVLILMALFLL